MCSEETGLLEVTDDRVLALIVFEMKDSSLKRFTRAQYRAANFSLIYLKEHFTMSALGQKRTLRLIDLVSALPPKADIAESD
jgi:hypothetical protein